MKEPWILHTQNGASLLFDLSALLVASWNGKTMDLDFTPNGTLNLSIDDYSHGDLQALWDYLVAKVHA